MPEEQALDLLSNKWPGRATAQQALQSSTTRESASFWAIAKEHGYNLQRKTQAPKSSRQTSPRAGEDSSALDGYSRPASLQALIQQLPDGWDPNTLKPQLLSAGRLDNMLPAAALRFNEMTLRAEVHTCTGWRQITDADLDSAYVVLSGKGWKVGSEPVEKAIIHNARQAPHHPVRAYLQQVEADPKIAPFDLNQIAPQFFRANQPLHVAMVRKWLIGAVSRALNPGCQMDYVLVMQGGQGQLKSTSLGALASPDWYCSSVPENEKDLLLNIHSTWIYELAELESVTSRKESGRLKNLITTSTDLVRVPYGKTSERMERQSVFCATVNEDTFLRDDTGNRRYWVIPTTRTQLDPIDTPTLIAERDAILSGAVHAYRNGDHNYLPPELATIVSEQNESYQVESPWKAPIVDWLNAASNQGVELTSEAILSKAIAKPTERQTRVDQMQVAAIMRDMGYSKVRRTIGGQLRWVFIKG